MERTRNWISNQLRFLQIFILMHLQRISWAKFFTEFILIIFFTVLPTIVVMLSVLFTTGKWGDDYQLYKGGEFLLYALSFFSSSLVAMNNKQFKVDDWRGAIKALLVIPLITISILYMSVFNTGGKVDKEILSSFSYGLMVTSLILFFFAQFWTNQRPTDVSEERHNEQSNIIDNIG